MAFQEVPDCAVVVVEQGNSSFLWTNSFAFVQAGFTQVQLQSLTETVQQIFAGEHDDALNAAFSIRGAVGYDMREEGAPTYVYSPAPTAGLHVGSPLPVQDALVLTIRTNTRGRSGRGRLYFTGYDEGQLNNAVFTQAVADDAIQTVDEIQEAAALLGWQYVIVSRYHNGAKRPVAVTYPVITWEVRSLIPGNQQRRSRRP